MSEPEIRRPVKKALCIGIEYVELSRCYPEFPMLTGAYQDTLIFKRLLQDIYGYEDPDIKVLTDAPTTDSSCQPTRDNIIIAMKELVKGARAGDRFVFHYSGHGSQVPAPPEHTEEVDNHDEVLWPADVQYHPDIPDGDGEATVGNYIVDNELHDILVEGLPAGAHLVIVLDCCSSGTGADLQFVSGGSPFTSPIEGRNPFGSRPRAGSVSVRGFGTRDDAEPTDAFPATKARSVIAMQHGLQGVVEDSGETIRSISSYTAPATKVDHLPYVTSWSACRDNQQTLESDSGGVFIQAFTDVLRDRPRPTHAELLKKLTRWFATNVKGPDTMKLIEPQLGSLRDIALIRDTPFDL